MDDPVAGNIEGPWNLLLDDDRHDPGEVVVVDELQGRVVRSYTKHPRMKEGLGRKIVGPVTQYDA